MHPDLRRFESYSSMSFRGRKMEENLLARIDYYLKERRLDRRALQYFLSDHDISCPVAYLGALAEPSDIYLIARFLGIPASALFEATKHKAHFMMAVFEEEWPSIEGRVQMSKSEAYRRILQDREFRGESNELRRQIRLTLQGLIAPKRRMLHCEYPDCSDDDCILRCKIMGHSRGPED